MRFWSVWLNLTPKAREFFINFGDTDYEALCKEHKIPYTQDFIAKLDNVNVVCMTAMYPGVFDVKSDTEAFQLKCLKKILITFLKTKPPRALNLKAVQKCLDWQRAAIAAEDKIMEIKQDCEGSIKINTITDLEGTQMMAQLDKILKRVQLGQLDGQLTHVGEWPSQEIQRMATRLDSIKAIVFSRRAKEMKRAEAAAEVSNRCYFTRPDPLDNLVTPEVLSVITLLPKILCYILYFCRLFMLYMYF
jgi:hypothetical protein